MSDQNEPVVIDENLPDTLDQNLKTPTIPSPNKETANPIRRLFGSSKALVVMAISALSFGLVFTGRAQWSEVSDFLKLVIGPWLLAQGLEDAAKKWRG